MEMNQGPPPYVSNVEGVPPGPQPTTAPYPQGYGAPPSQAGYGAPPPQAGYGAPPPQEGYGAPPPQAVYAPPPVQYAYPPPQAAPVQQSTNNVTVVQAGQQSQTVVVQQKAGVNHCLHCCISLFFPFWIFVWIFLCITN